MGRAYKNFWSLNTDEAVVTGILRDATPKDNEVLMPVNAQMKDVDLYIINTKSKKTISIQVKGSRAYESSLKRIEEFGNGSSGWFFLKEDTIAKATADYFIFLVYVIRESKKTGRRVLEPHTITISTKELNKLSKKHKKIIKAKSGNMYNYFIYVNPEEKEAFDFKEKNQGNLYYLSEYLDEKGFEKLNRDLS